MQLANPYVSISRKSTQKDEEEQPPTIEFQESPR
jgi:hypothetical protein